MGDMDGELTFYCIHDADAAGTVIYEKLQEATAARPARRVQVVNLGLEPEEGLDMGLQVEPVEQKGRRRPVASYVAHYWKQWLQRSRIELNAMTTPQFIAWLDQKFTPLAGKVNPPQHVAQALLTERVQDGVRNAITTRILKEADIDRRVAEAMPALLNEIEQFAPSLPQIVERAFEENSAQSWRDVIAALADEYTRAES